MLDMLTICLSSFEGRPPLFSVIDDAMGPCDDSFDFRCQAELKEVFHRHCNKLGRSMGERIRELMALDSLGQDHVQSMVAARLSVIGIQAPTTVPTGRPADVRTAVGD